MRHWSRRAVMWLGAVTPAAAIPAQEHVLEARTVSKRATDQTVIPVPISVPPSQYWDGNDGPWSTFAMQIGTPAQFVRVIASTAGWVSWGIGPDGCPDGFVADCSNKRGFVYLRNQSLTWVQNSRFLLGFEQNLDLNPSAWSGFDTVTLGFKGSGGPSISHSSVYVVDSTKHWLGGFGLNPVPANYTTMNDPQISFMQSLKNNNSIASLSYGYTAGNQYRFNKVAGSLTLGGYDQNRFTPANFSFPMYNDVQRDLVVNLQAISTDSNSSLNLLPSGGIPMFVDSTVGQIYLPLDACQAFETAFGLVWNTTYNFYVVSATQRSTLLAQNANVTFTLGTTNSGGNNVKIVLPYRAFDLQLEYPNALETTYYFPLKRASNETQYTLGRTFLQEAYLIADYERRNFSIAPCTWDQTLLQSTNLRTIFTPGADERSSGGSSLGGGAIAGIVIGAIAALLIVAGVFWFLRRRSRSTQARINELEAKEAQGDAKEAPSSINDDATTDAQSPTVPTGDELDSGQVHELNNASKKTALEMASPHTVDPTNHGYSEVEGTVADKNDKRFAYEMDGVPQAIYEMPGSDVQELSTPVQTSSGQEKRG